MTRSWKNARLSIACAVAILGGSPLCAAHAEQANPEKPAPVDGAIYNKAGDKAIGVFEKEYVFEGETRRGAMMVLQYEHTGSDYRSDGTYGALVVVFPSAADWDKFVSIWDKAKRLSNKFQEQYFKDESYFDGQTMLDVGPYGREGDVSFTMGGNGHNEQNVPNDIEIYDLSRKDFARFDTIVTKVSAYFRGEAAR